MTGALLAGIAGLALLDALNPATIAGVVLLLIAPLRRPITAAAAFVAGAYVTVLGVGAALLLGASAADDAVSDASTWTRRIALLGAAAGLAWVAARRLQPRLRRPVTLPSWIGVATAAPLGVLMTGADLPNAFPYLIAIERLTAAEIDAGSGLVVLAAYALVYCGPCLVVLIAAALLGDRARVRLTALHARLGAEKRLPARPLMATAGLAAAAALAAIALLW